MEPGGEAVDEPLPARAGVRQERAEHRRQGPQRSLPPEDFGPGPLGRTRSREKGSTRRHSTTTNPTRLLAPAKRRPSVRSLAKPRSPPSMTPAASSDSVAAPSTGPTTSETPAAPVPLASVRSLRQATHAAALRTARSCYDHPRPSPGARPALLRLSAVTGACGLNVIHIRPGKVAAPPKTRAGRRNVGLRRGGSTAWLLRWSEVRDRTTEARAGLPGLA